jgi:hypothetical protein
VLSRADRIKFASQNLAQPTPPLISPVKGWNTRDALDAMDPADAVLLDNWFPDAGGVIVRNGYTSYATRMGSGGAVNTLIEYSSGSTNKFLAACDDSIYDISASGAVGVALGSGYGSSEWQTAAFLGKLFFFNGNDTAQVYNGSTIGNASFTGVTLSSLIGGCIYQNRLFTWASNSTGFYYALLNSISGALTFYDLSAFTPHGGNLIATITYSHDGGNGVLDFIAFIMSSGDVLIYYGNDPSDVNNWQLIGIYRISPPVSPRAVCNYGAEAFLTTYDDHVPLSQQLVALREGRIPPRSKVSGAVQAAVQANAGAFGWQALYYPAGRRLIFNIPNPDGTFSQHVQNTGITYIDPNTAQQVSPWCRFINMNGTCFGLFKNVLYFGGAAGVVYQADVGTLDVLGPVVANAQQSWNTFQSPERKLITAARPIVQSNGQVAYSFGLGYDYGDINISVAVATGAAGSPWDISPWDTSPWSPSPILSTLWHAAGGTGVAISGALSFSATQGASWLRTDFKFQQGDAL